MNDLLLSQSHPILLIKIPEYRKVPIDIAQLRCLAFDLLDEALLQLRDVLGQT
jgi:hypothetical protein